jgi:hypothetical protein
MKGYGQQQQDTEHLLQVAKDQVTRQPGIRVEGALGRPGLTRGLVADSNVEDDHA